MAKKRSTIQAKYDSTHCKSLVMKLHIVNDADILEKLDTVESKQGYIKRLIRDDLNRIRTNSSDSAGTATEGE